jgi:hypothetical protein
MCKVNYAACENMRPWFISEYLFPGGTEEKHVKPVMTNGWHLMKPSTPERNRCATRRPSAVSKHELAVRSTLIVQ